MHRRRGVSLVLFLFAAFFTIPCPAQRLSLPERIELELDKLVKAYEHLHSHPELSYREQQSSAYLARELRSLGYEVTERVGEYDHPQRTPYGLVGVMENGQGPTVMVRTDMDALPVKEKTGLPYASHVRTENESGEEVGVMHACGHDIHMASFLGTARMLSQLKQEWQGTLVMIGQPAEERGAGSRAMLKDGLYQRFPRPDYVLGLHADASMEAGKIGYRPGYALANVDAVDITIFGVGGHGAFPHATRDPITLAAQVVMALQTIVSREISPLNPAVVSVGSIHGGSKHNIIPGEVHLQLTVRSYKQEVQRKILEAIKRITQGIAAGAGIPAEKAPIVTVAEEEYVPATFNNPELVGRLIPVFERLLGADNVIKKDPIMGGEDFSRYSLEDHSIPACMFWLGAIDPARMATHRLEGKSLPSLHSAYFAPSPRPTIKTAVTIMTRAVMELLRK